MLHIESYVFFQQRHNIIMRISERVIGLQYNDRIYVRPIKNAHLVCEYRRISGDTFRMLRTHTVRKK